MPEATTTAETAAPEATTTTETATSEKLTPPPELQAIIDKERQTARDAEKARKAAVKELDDLRQKTMTADEKTVADAKAEGRAAALVEVGGKVARAEIRAAAAGRLDADALNVLLDGIDVAKFIDDNGEVDAAKVTAFVNGITPEPDETTVDKTFVDLGQGARGSNANASLNGDPLLRDLKSKLGIR